MRSKGNIGEGYKQRVYEASRTLLKNEDSYTDAILKALPGEGLAFRRYDETLSEKLDKKGRDNFEEALKLLYDEDKDEQAFNAICNIVGRPFHFLGFVFFLKDSTKYMPISPENFDDRFKLLGLDSRLSKHCTWEKYQQYNEWIKEVRDYLVSKLNKEITLLDAHSFLWILDSKAVSLKEFANTIVNEEEDVQLNADLNNLEELKVDEGFDYKRKKEKRPDPVYKKGQEIPQRNRQKAMNALAHAHFKCENDNTHQTFISKRTGRNYVEAHHLVPMNYWKRFNCDIDQEENIVSLCSNCHSEIHHGRDARDLIKKLYDKRKELLKDIGVQITLEELFDMYDGKLEE